MNLCAVINDVEKPRMALEPLLKIIRKTQYTLVASVILPHCLDCSHRLSVSTIFITQTIDYHSDPSYDKNMPWLPSHSSSF